MFHGPYSTSDKRVHDGRVNRVAIGNHFCLSGAFSESFCSFKVDAYNQTITTDWGTMYDAFLATRTLSGGVGGAGDSGAPNMIWVWDPEDSRWESRAVGLHAASDGSIACVGIATTVGL